MATALHDDHRGQTIPKRLEGVSERWCVQPVFLTKEEAIHYATSCACFRAGEIRILDSRGAVERIIPFDETERRL
jgi:hypothetical protein